MSAFEPEWVPKKGPPYDCVFMFDDKSGVLGTSVHTRYSLAKCEVGKICERFGSAGADKASRWTHYWHIEFHVRTGWSPRFLAHGEAKSMKHAKVCVMNAVRAFIASDDVKRDTKGDEQLRVENDILRDSVRPQCFSVTSAT